MSASLNKVIVLLLNPYVIGFLGIALAICFRRRSKVLASLLAVSFVWLWVWSTGWWYAVVGGGLESLFPPVAPADRTDLADLDAVDILGGSMGINTNDCTQPEMLGSADRVWTGAQVWKQHTNAWVVCSGGGTEATTLPLLKDLGVPAERVLFIEQAANTEDEARMIGALVRGKSPRERPKIALVTSAWHMRRALFLFRRNCGCEVVPVACDYECTTGFGASHAWTWWDFVPNPQYLTGNCYLAKEYIAYWGYRVKYRRRSGK